MGRVPERAGQPGPPVILITGPSLAAGHRWSRPRVWIFIGADCLERIASNWGARRAEGPGMLTEQEAEEFRIRQLVEKWALTRDAGDWDGFASVWHEDSWMTATWFQGPSADFIRASREGFEADVNILHFLGGFRCEVTGDRAV